jgi:hypothetical protein
MSAHAATATSPASPLGGGGGGGGGASASAAAARSPPTTLQGSPLSERQVEDFERTQRATLAADTAFLASFPELPALLAEFTKACLEEKPADLRAFAAEYFARPVERGPG